MPQDDKNARELFGCVSDADLFSMMGQTNTMIRDLTTVQTFVICFDYEKASQLLERMTGSIATLRSRLDEAEASKVSDAS